MHNEMTTHLLRCTTLCVPFQNGLRMIWNAPLRLSRCVHDDLNYTSKLKVDRMRPVNRAVNVLSHLA